MVGNGYDPAWPAKADELGITHIDSGVEAINKFVAEKNVEDVQGERHFRRR